jgi:UDPglucose 6-dehydrogenase
MKVTVIGTGYVGLVTGTCLAEVGNHVVCVDKDVAKVEALRQGRLPIHEPGLDALVESNVRGRRLRFTSDLAEGVAHGEVLMIAVGTPPEEDGSADLSHVLAVAEAIGAAMDEHAYRVVATKSTVPVGTADRVRAAVEQAQAVRGVQTPFSVVSNPEFLKEGAAVEDFMKPDRIVIGVEDDRAERVMRELYEPFNRSHDRTISMDIRSAELTKYAANAMLATKISFMNEIANLAERLGADVEQIRQGIGSDPRIGWHFIYPGCGYGGSCFPKDVRALHRTAAEAGYEARILAAVEAVNDTQKRILVDKIRARFGSDLSGLRFALWGLAFKPETDDMREAPSRVTIDALIQGGAEVVAHDPVAMEEARRLYPDTGALRLCEDAYEALVDADALLVVTEWKAFRSPDLTGMLGRMRTPVVFDGRNVFDPARMRSAGFEYFGIGR